MSCVALIGGIIGCGKTTFIKYLEDNKNDLFTSDTNSNDLCTRKIETNDKSLCKIVLDELCSIEEQAEMMKSLKGWKCFRADLLIATEHLISTLLDTKFTVHGPLAERSLLLLEKLKIINEMNIQRGSHFVFLIEDNFYYRSMRYEWFQLSRRANIGFCEIFLDCPLDVAISRNSSRGYSIPEEKIKRMRTFMEYPEPEKYKWEKFSIVFDTSGDLDCESLKQIIAMFEEAAKNPAEMMMMSEKIQAQSICSKNLVHQADKILRKSVSKAVFSKQGQIPKEKMDGFISSIVRVRQTVLSSIKNGEIDFPRALLESLKSQGIEKVQKEFEETVIEKFEEAVNEKLYKCDTLFPAVDKVFLSALNAVSLNNSPNR